MRIKHQHINWKHAISYTWVHKKSKVGNLENFQSNLWLASAAPATCLLSYFSLKRLVTRSGIRSNCSKFNLGWIRSCFHHVWQLQVMHLGRLTFLKLQISRQACIQKPIWKEIPGKLLFHCSIEMSHYISDSESTCLRKKGTGLFNLTVSIVWQNHSVITGKLLFLNDI